MNQHLQKIFDTIKEDKNLSEEEKNTIIKSLKDADKEIEIANFKLDRTEKVKRTTAILLEETIEELEQKRKAVEAQNKELEIETSLERVRAVAMSMMKADDLLRICEIQFHELSQLGFTIIRNALIGIFNDEKNHFTDYDYSDFAGGNIHTIPYHKNSVVDRAIIRMKSAKDAFTEFIVEGEELEEWKAFRKSNGEYDDTRITETKRLFYYFYSIESGNIGISTFEKITEPQLNILKRFRNVFDLAYKRYVDISKAAAQAREAQIEAALEKVRSRSLAMQKSEELKEVIQVVYEQFVHLKINTEHTGFVIDYKIRDDRLIWVASKHGVPSKLTIPYFDSEYYNSFNEAKEKGWDFFATNLSFEQKNIFYRKLFKYIPDLPEDAKEFYFNCPGLAISTVLLENVALYIENFEGIPYSDEDNAILMRFGKVFQQTYTRFLDLQKAEAQAREAKIEASLERVRSKAMSMQKSEDLAAAITIVFEELGKLDLGILRCGIGVLHKEKRTADVWTTTIADNNTVVQVAGDESMDIHPLLSGAFDAWLNHEDHSYTLKGEDLTNYYKAVARENFKLPDSQSLVSGAEGKEQYYFNAVYSSGGLFAFRETPFPEEAKAIMRRFADVFTLTYTRFSDLKQAEAQAKEARIEVALERVRSRTLAMQRSDELAETAAVLFRQLILLGIQPNRLYIAIVKDQAGNSEFWITDEDGSKVSSAFETNLNNNPTFKKMFAGWKAEKKSLVIDMQGEELQEYFKYLTSINVPFKEGLSQKRRLQDIAYFSNGFIGIASPEELPTETILLLERFAAVFNLTYTRFNDLKIAEAHALQAEQDLIAIKEAKQKAEDALTELQSTQKQLIQSEKMASLGELTAGIAHEIQNPLNFVNNFSEVSKELIEEMVEEVNKGNNEEVIAIANDLVQNLEKINHHGKRADAIVKGMLQHSRSSNSTKEPTDINKLADEYLRLAYHGLRAKDKSFNATLKTDYDESIGNINIIPQDIGRVILNLITNAFYVVDEKKKSATVNYEPTVSVSTKKTTDKILISVKDNGNGIPQKVLDKIFQPFFTTKPTGQGTGLGLSLSYDIVKAHSGELNVETKEGEGTSFIISLPG